MSTAAIIVAAVGLILLAGFAFFLFAWMEERWRRADVERLLPGLYNQIGILKRDLSHREAELAAARGAARADGQ